MSNIKAEIVDGKLSCVFTRDIVTTLTLPQGLGEVTIDLDKTQFYLELAMGPTANGNIAHHTNKGVSKNTFKF